MPPSQNNYPEEEISYRPKIFGLFMLMLYYVVNNFIWWSWMVELGTDIKFLGRFHSNK